MGRRRAAKKDWFSLVFGGYFSSCGVNSDKLKGCSVVSASEFGQRRR